MNGTEGAGNFEPELRELRLEVMKWHRGHSELAAENARLLRELGKYEEQAALVAAAKLEVAQARNALDAVRRSLDDANALLLRRTSSLDRLKGACMAAIRAAGGVVHSTNSTPTPGSDDVAAALVVALANRGERVSMLRAALAKYGRHLNSCDSLKHPAEPGPVACNCGLESIR